VTKPGPLNQDSFYVAVCLNVCVTMMNAGADSMAMPVATREQHHVVGTPTWRLNGRVAR
jgi:hypothetical protein